MHREYRAPEWDTLRMDYQNPFAELEPEEREITIVAQALDVMLDVGAITHTRYPHERFLAHRRAVAENFEIPWTAITPRMQRFIYALNAIRKPANMIAAGVFCGNTFISNAGAGVGPGACYTAENLIGVEIKPEEAERAERNVRRIDPTGIARVVAADGIRICRDFDRPVDLLYLDADGTPEQGKGVYLDILEACYADMPAGALVLAHNSVNAAERLSRYLSFVRDDAHFRASVNVILDGEGLEVSLK